MSEKVEVVLTFDDGPHAGGNSSQNKTRLVMKVLELKGIRGVFFIQSHAHNKEGEPFRGNTGIGRAIIEDMIVHGHIVGPHTGLDGKGAHAWVNRHTNRNLADVRADMERAKNLIHDLGGTAEFVRPPFGLADDKVIDIYTDLGLEYVHWDVAPEGRWDGGKTIFAQTADQVQANMRSQIRDQLKTGKRQLVVLFHDIQDRVAYHIKSHIKELKRTIEKEGFTPEMKLSKSRTKEILRAQSPKNYLGARRDN